MKSRSFSRRGGQAILLSKHSNTIGDIIFAPGLSQQLSSFENLVNQLGFAGYCLGAVAGAVDRTIAVSASSSGPVEKFVNSYVEAKLAANDPILDMTLNQTKPFIWPSLVSSRQDPTKMHGLRAVLSLRNENFLGASVTVPLNNRPDSLRRALALHGPAEMSARRLEDDFGHEIALASFASQAIADSVEEARQSFGENSQKTISNAERAVLSGLASGLRPSEIADERGRSEHTIRAQMASAQRTLGARTSAQAVAIALRKGIITL